MKNHISPTKQNSRSAYSKLDCGDRQNFEVYRRLDTVSHKLIVKKLVGQILLSALCMGKG